MLVLLSLWHIMWWSTRGPKCCLANGGHSQCKAAVTYSGDGDGDGGGGRTRVFVVFG